MLFLDVFLSTHCPLRSCTILTWLSFPPSSLAGCIVSLATQRGNRHREAQDFALQSLLRVQEPGTDHKIELLGSSKPGIRTWYEKQYHYLLGLTLRP